MLQALRLPGVLSGIRSSVLKGGKVMEDTAPQPEEALDRLLSRAELELLSPQAVQRREIIAHLKLAAASAKAEDAPEAPRANA